MLKPCLTFLLAILIPILVSYKATAQEDENWIFKSVYSGKYYGSPYETRSDIFARSVSGRFSIGSTADVKLIIKKGLEDEVIAVELAAISTTNLPIVFADLSRFPKLAYIRLLGKGTLNQNEKLDQLVANINKLPQLKGIEFAYADKIDMDKALKKLIPLKQLRILSFTEYKQELPPIFTALTQIDSVKLNTINIGNNDLSDVSWTRALIVGNAKSWADASGILAKEQEKPLLSLAKNKALKRLDLYTDLRYPDIISKFTQIEALRIAYYNSNPTPPFFKAVGSLKQLQHLYLDISGVDADIEELKNLTQLRSLFLNLNTVPINKLEVLENLKNLERLEIGNSKIGALPDIFQNTPQLKTVRLNNTEITKIPASLFNLPLLENLDLSHNQIAALPDIITYGCKNLRRINLMENKLTAIPQAFEGLSQLEIINCTDNKIAAIPGGWEYFQNLKDVNFARNQLTAFPDGLQNNHSVERITLMFNKIETFPDVMGGNFKLRYLGLTGAFNTFELPAHIGNYSDLDTLEAEQLSLRSLPESLGDCKKLKMILFSRSIIKRCSLPLGLKEAKDLETLYLNDNPLLDHQSIFDVILAVPRKSLRVNLSDDNISELPSTKKWLTTPFISLDLKNNPINQLPVDFINSKVINNVNLQGTNLQNKKAPSN